MTDTDVPTIDPRPHEAMAPGAAAQAAYYRELSDRFARMAAEFEPDTRKDPDNPLPHHRMTAVIVLHAESHEQLAERIHGVEVNWYHLYTDYGQKDSGEWTSDGHIWFRTVDPDLTPELYRAEADRWFAGINRPTDPKGSTE